MKVVKIKGVKYELKTMGGYDLTKLAEGLSEADAGLKLIVATVKGMTEKDAKALDAVPYIELSKEVQTFHGLRRDDIKKPSS